MSHDMNIEGSPLAPPPEEAQTAAVIFDVEAINKDEGQMPSSPLLFSLETAPEPITADDISHSIVETNEKDDDDETDQSDASSDDQAYKPSEATNIGTVEAAPVADSKVNQSGSIIFSSFFDLNNSSKEFPWMEYKIEDIPAVDDTEILQKIDSEFTIQKLVETIRAN